MAPSQPPRALHHPTKYHLQQQLQQSFTGNVSMGNAAQSHGSHLVGSPDSDLVDYTDAFLSPTSPLAPLDDIDDLDYQTGLTFQRHAAQPHAASPQFVSDGWLGTSPPGPMVHSPQPIPLHGAMQNLALSAPATVDSQHLSFGHSPPTWMPWPSQVGSPSGPRSLEDDYVAQINLQRAMEKRRQRRESHNAVERRRRDNINERIQELGQLLPEGMLDLSGVNKPNKGVILKKTVEYIRWMKQETDAYPQLIQDLEHTLRSYQKQQPSHLSM